MTEKKTTTGQSLMPVEDSHSVANAFADTALFEQFQRAAKLMATSDLVPTHLRDKQANCFLVLNQAYRWQMDPFAVAQCTFVVHGRLGYEGKLVAAAINCNPEIDKRLNYKYSGEGNERTVICFGKLVEDDEERTVEIVLKNVITSNDLWKKQTDQQLAYSGARHWARRHLPEVILGVYTRDELSFARDNQKPSAVTATDLIEQAAEGEAIEDAEFEESSERAPPSLAEEGPSPKPPSGGGSTPDQESPEDAPGEPPSLSGPDTAEKPATPVPGPQAVALIAEIAKAKTENEMETVTARFDGLGDDDLAAVRAAAQTRMSEIAAQVLAAG